VRRIMTCVQNGNENNNNGRKTYTETVRQQSERFKLSFYTFILIFPISFH